MSRPGEAEANSAAMKAMYLGGPPDHAADQFPEVATIIAVAYPLVAHSVLSDAAANLTEHIEFHARSFPADQRFRDGLLHARAALWLARDARLPCESMQGPKTWDESGRAEADQ